MLGENRFLVVGLGNPGKKYGSSRHNAGFLFLDFLANELSFSFQSKNTYEIATPSLEGRQLVFLKPLQYMNLSGLATQSMMAYYKIPPEHVIVCYDDTAFDPGVFKLKHNGSAGGHNGLDSIIRELGTKNFLRIRIGVGAKNSIMKLSDYVLSSFSGKEKEILKKEVFPNALESLKMILTDGIEKAMGRYNASS